MSLQASIVSVHGSPLLKFELRKVFNFDLKADLDPDSDPAIHAYEPDTQPCVLLYTVFYSIYKFSLYMFSFNLLVVP
jgi:hypothetical protein